MAEVRQSDLMPREASASAKNGGIAPAVIEI